MMEQASQWTSGNCGMPTRATTTRASGRRNDPDDGLHHHLSSTRRSDFHSPRSMGVWPRPP
jgi:hypothetical protein